MRHVREIAIAVACAGAVSGVATAALILDGAAAVAEARKYVKGRCNAKTPCTFEPRREGKQWNVRVTFTKRNSAGEKPYPDGYLLLYFDGEGRLVRRVEGE